MTLLDQPLYDIDDFSIAGIVLPGDPAWDEARQAWNLAVDQHPVAVATPETVEGVAAAVRYARLNGLAVAVQGTGHGAAARASLRGSLLLRTSGLTGVEIDAEAGRVRVAAGALWGEVSAPASELGLAALAGSSIDVGVVGYAVGGGIGWLSRKYGLAANSILAAEILTADGLHLRVDPDHEPDLYWAIRGGGGVPGVITALELSLFPVEDVYAGTLMWPVERASEVLRRWAAWTATTPDEITSVGRIRRFPDIPRVPEAMRGRTLVVVEAAYLGPEDEGAALLAPLRDLGPEIDTFATVPPVALGFLHMDPLGPSAGLNEHVLLSELPVEAIDAVVELAGAGSGSPLMSLELRQLGGALGRDPVEPGALGRLDAAFAVVAVGVPSAGDGGAAVSAYLRRVVDRLDAWSEGRSYLNFAGRPTDARTAFDVDAFRRLAAVKAEYDPDDVFRPGHRIRVA